MFPFFYRSSFLLLNGGRSSSRRPETPGGFRRDVPHNSLHESIRGMQPASSKPVPRTSPMQVSDRHQPRKQHVPANPLPPVARPAAAAHAHTPQLRPAMIQKTKLTKNTPTNFTRTSLNKHCKMYSQSTHSEVPFRRQKLLRTSEKVRCGIVGRIFF